MKLFCEYCRVEFDAEMWECGDCPFCNRQYIWREEWTSDNKESWLYPEWL